MNKKIVRRIVVGICAAAVIFGVCLIFGSMQKNNENGEQGRTEEVSENIFGNLDFEQKKDETVYVISSASGKTEKVYVGSVLDSDFDLKKKNNLPVSLSISYFLDGKEISPEEIKGKSGRVKMEFDYRSEKTVQGKKVPFLAISGMTLDALKFKNVEVKNGKVAESNSGTIVVGAALVGLNEDLELSSENRLPDSFEVSADVQDFSLSVTYTVATNEVFSEFDTTKLSSVDELVSAMNLLSSSTEQILSGSTQIADGLDEMLSQSSALVSGVEKLDEGLTALAENSDLVNSGIDRIIDQVFLTAGEQINMELEAKLDELEAKVREKIGGLDEKTRKKIEKMIPQLKEELRKNLRVAEPLTRENYAEELDRIADFLTRRPTKILDKINALTEEYGVRIDASIDFGGTKIHDVKMRLDGYCEFYGILKESYSPKLEIYTDGVKQAAAGVSEMRKKMPALTEGVTALRDGSRMLEDGISRLKTEGIDKLTSVANDDFQPLVLNIRKTVDASRGYHFYQNSKAESVKFIFKTAGV